MELARIAVAFVGLAVIFWIAGRRRAMRHRRERHDMRHIVGAPRWWGKR
jgi:hypothetical protein